MSIPATVDLVNHRRNLIQVPLAGALYPKPDGWNESMIAPEWLRKMGRKEWVGLDIKFRWKRKRKEIRLTQETVKRGTDYVDTRQITRDTYSVPGEIDLPFHLRLHWGYYMSDHTQRWKQVPWHCQEVCPTAITPNFSTSLYNENYEPSNPHVATDGYWEELERQAGEFVANSRRLVYYYDYPYYGSDYDDTLPTNLDIDQTWKVDVHTTAPESSILSTCVDEPGAFVPRVAIDDLNEGTARDLFLSVTHTPTLFREWPTDPDELRHQLETAFRDALFITVFTGSPFTNWFTLQIPIGRPDSAVPGGGENKGQFSIGGREYDVYTTGEYDHDKPDDFNVGTPVDCSSSNNATYLQHTFPAGQQADYNLIEDIAITELEDPPPPP